MIVLSALPTPFQGQLISPYHRRWFVLLLCGVALGGCNRRPEMAQVSGKVLYKDGTVPRGGVRSIQFEPAADSPAEIRKAASSEIRDDGTFQLYTRRPGDGVYLGNYSVTFAVWKGPMDPTSLIQEKYTASATTPYKVTVDGDKDDLFFEIEPLSAKGGGAN